MMQLLFSLFLLSSAHARPIVIGSKAFTEGYILAELSAQTLLSATPPFEVQRRFGMGGTGILFAALKSHDIDLYSEYTGTIAEAILKKPELKTIDEIRAALLPLGLTISDSLGFDNSYAIAVSAAAATKYNLRKLSDVAAVAKNLKAGISHEYMTRSDGFQNLRKRYKFDFAGEVQSMEHALSYQAIATGAVDLIDVYSTDAKIEKLNLKVLEDDLHVLPLYQAVHLARLDFTRDQPAAWLRLRTMEGSLSAEEMIHLNGQVDLDQVPVQQAVEAHQGLQITQAASLSRQIWQRTKEHTLLVGVALLFSILVGIPLGVLANNNLYLGQGILLVSGIVQTIPSLALLSFLIPLFGIGFRPALVALCLYGLLPIVVNTFVGLRSIDPLFVDMSNVLGLSWWQSLWRLRLPLASRSILAGIKTSAVIGIGMATLAALIGAGGYGAPILMGLTTGDMRMILIGAIPASVMAVLANVILDRFELRLIPKGLR